MNESLRQLVNSVYEDKWSSQVDHDKIYNTRMINIILYGDDAKTKWRPYTTHTLQHRHSKLRRVSMITVPQDLAYGQILGLNQHRRRSRFRVVYKK